MSRRLAPPARLAALLLAIGACSPSEKVQVKETRSDGPDRRPAETRAAPAPPSLADELVEPLRGDTVADN